MAKNLNSRDWEKLFASEASGPQKNLKMGLGGNFTFCGYGLQTIRCLTHSKTVGSLSVSCSIKTFRHN